MPTLLLAWVLLTDGVDEPTRGGPVVSSPIADDEVVVFFPTLGRRLASGSVQALAHGWIYEPESDSRTRAATVGVVRRLLGLSPTVEENAVFRDRARLFVVDNERGKKIPVRIGRKTQILPGSDASGHFQGMVELSAAEVESLSRERVGRLEFQALSSPDDSRVFSGVVHVLRSKGLSVISDIDDTVKVTGVGDHAELLANTFLRPFREVPGMATLYARLARQGARFHYVSSSPWQLYPSLARFLAEYDFPAGSFHLRDFRLKDSSFFNLFASPEETKPRAIEPILGAFPERHFLLVGDSGEKDPEVYGTLARRYPDQVERILIRDTNPEGVPVDAERFEKAFRNIPSSRWQVFRDPAEVKVSGLGDDGRK